MKALLLSTFCLILLSACSSGQELRSGSTQKGSALKSSQGYTTPPEGKTPETTDANPVEGNMFPGSEMPSVDPDERITVPAQVTGGAMTCEYKPDLKIPLNEALIICRLYLDGQSIRFAHTVLSWIARNGAGLEVDATSFQNSAVLNEARLRLKSTGVLDATELKDVILVANLGTVAIESGIKMLTGLPALGQNVFLRNGENCLTMSNNGPGVNGFLTNPCGYVGNEGVQVGGSVGAIQGFTFTADGRISALGRCMADVPMLSRACDETGFLTFDYIEGRLRIKDSNNCLSANGTFPAASACDTANLGQIWTLFEILP